MTLKTVTGPTIRAALADARRLFGDDAVLLESSSPADGRPARVTVAYDAAPVPQSAARAVPARPAAPSPTLQAAPPPRTYGYGPVRPVKNNLPLWTEAASAPVGPTPVGRPSAVASPPPPAFAPAPASPPAAAPAAALAAALADRAEIDGLRARLAALEAALSRQATSAEPARPAPPLARRTVVLVGAAGSGKTSVAARLGRSAGLLGAAHAAVLVIAPDDAPFHDPAPYLWATGVPAVVVRSPDEVAGALQTLADADLLVVDTPALPLDPERARPLVGRLGRILAALAPLDVVFVADAGRRPLAASTVEAAGLRPDALALTRLDEAVPGAEARWTAATGWPLLLASSGPHVTDLSPPPPPALPDGFVLDEVSWTSGTPVFDDRDRDVTVGIPALS